ncbi:MAG: hypothetical protein C3F11_17900 [Methylocystaceae bacterium]|nr:MAG: hypothetical protein C3F11_17900 [Methylocystaceae bacterium]
MSISLSAISLPPSAKALVDILRLEAGPGALPLSSKLAGASLAAYGLGEAGLQLLDHDVAPAVAYGVVSAALLVAVTAVVLFFVGARERFVQTLTALGATGAIVAIATILLHLFVAQVFPPPLPTSKLVGFILFPLVIWNVTVFTWLYRHASLRFIPALAVAACYIGITSFIIAPLIVRISERI